MNDYGKGLPLKERVPFIVEYLNRFEYQEVYEKKLLDIYSGMLQPYVEEALAREISDPIALKIAKERIAPINICSKIINKEGRTYAEQVERECEGEGNVKDEELLEYYINEMKIDTVLSRADKLLCLHKYVTLEPFWNEGCPSLRVVPADRHKWLSDDESDPTRPTMYIKYMGTRRITVQTTNVDGVMFAKPQDVIKDFTQYYIYTDEEFIIVDVDSNSTDFIIRDDLLEANDIVNYVNPYGVVPAILVSKPDFNLIPYPDTDLYQGTILISKIFTDLNYSCQFNSHSTYYGIDVEATNLNSNPDAFITLQTTEGDNKHPQIGVLTPKMDVAGGVQLASVQLELILQMRGHRPGATGKPYDQAASGIAKMIDEMDLTVARQEAQTLWADVEYKLWDLIKTLHNTDWSQREGQEYTYGFSDMFEVEVQFKMPEITLSEEDTLKNIKVARDLGLMSKKTALSRLYPDMSEDSIDEMLQEIAEEGQEAVQQAQETMNGNQNNSEGNSGEVGQGDNEGDSSEDQTGQVGN